MINATFKILNLISNRIYVVFLFNLCLVSDSREHLSE